LLTIALTATASFLQLPLKPDLRLYGRYLGVRAGDTGVRDCVRKPVGLR
jgi:hypothetical protein